MQVPDLDRGPAKSPTALWRILNQGALPGRGACWADLLDHFTLGQLRLRARKRGAGAPAEVTSWNTRWLASAAT
eukprot:9506085-Lingulodinium_polyedra.AAC.1